MLFRSGHGTPPKIENAPANLRGWATAHGTTPVSSWRGHSSALNARHTPRSSQGGSGVACPAAHARACTVPSRLGAAGRTGLRHCLIILSHFPPLSTGNVDKKDPGGLPPGPRFHYFGSYSSRAERFRLSRMSWISSSSSSVPHIPKELYPAVKSAQNTVFPELAVPILMDTSTPSGVW